ncbi:heparinase II/III family protein [Sphingomicrobium lutaoense]|uniref:Putative heparinase superfamily protein n=1 Tax=Sphingomicrobium lutaoense TaxID=515949 RepID=A0A839Z0G2_9SPHN|nr:heparinase II/III family protein [Sphingomicrobium lutaoense]MBB3764756.1 putative heparinase superfamily protein [Sphingomicrobium lutaoense]
MAEGADIVGRLARGSLFQRLLGPKRKPLRLTAVPRDHVEGDRRLGRALLGGTLVWGAEQIDLVDFDFARIDMASPAGRRLSTFAWLRDLSAASSREQGARIGEALAGRWLIAHGTRPDAAWAPELWGERLLFWTAYAPYILSSRDSGYRSALLNTLARGARHLDAQADRARPGLDRITAWAGLVTAALTLQGGLPRVARAESGLMRALAQGQFEDGGLMSRHPQEQALLVDRLGLVRSAYFAAKQQIPDGLENAAAAALAALHGVSMGDGALSSWQGGNPGSPTAMAALIEGCGMRARPLREARGWGYQRMGALGTVVVLDAAPPPLTAMTASGSASTLAFEMSDGTQRLIVNCGGPGLAKSVMPHSLVEALRSSAAHSTLILDDSNSTAIQPDGPLGRGVSDVIIDRNEDNDASRIRASHDGYLRRYGMLHERQMSLGNDGKELSGVDRLTPKGRRKIKGELPFAIRFHLAPGVEPTPTADGMGAILRSEGAPPWNFRCHGAPLTIEESLHVTGRGEPNPTQQLVINGEVSRLGVEIGWQLRRSS